MNIVLNGEQQVVPDGVSLQELLRHLAIEPERVAVELNLSIVKKADYAATLIHEGDALEVVSFMGGGQGPAGGEKGPARGHGDAGGGEQRRDNDAVPAVLCGNGTRGGTGR